MCGVWCVCNYRKCTWAVIGRIKECYIVEDFIEVDELDERNMSAAARKQDKQAGTVLGQAQLKLELELYFTSLKICCIKLIKLVKLHKLGGATSFILQNLLRNCQHIL